MPVKLLTVCIHIHKTIHTKGNLELRKMPNCSVQEHEAGYVPDTDLCKASTADNSH